MKLDAPCYDWQQTRCFEEMAKLADLLATRIRSGADSEEIAGILSEIGRLARLRKAYRAEIARLQKGVQS